MYVKDLKEGVMYRAKEGYAFFRTGLNFAGDPYAYALVDTGGSRNVHLGKTLIYLGTQKRTRGKDYDYGPKKKTARICLIGEQVISMDPCSWVHVFPLLEKT